MRGKPQSRAGRSPTRGLSLRVSLVLGFGALLLLTSSAIVLNNIHASRRVVRSLSTSLLRQTTSLAEMKLQSFFGDLAGLNAGAARRTEAGFLTWGDWDGMRRYMLPILERHPHLSGVGAGDGEGNAWSLRMRDDCLQTEIIQPSKWGRRSFWQEWDDDGNVRREWWEDESTYDPRVRPWYLGALAVARASATNTAASRMPVPHWTAPYRFFTTGEDGVTVATRVPWTNGLDAVIYFDLTLKQLDAFVQASRPSSNGYTLVLNDDLEVIAWPGKDDVARDKVLTGERRAEVAAGHLPLLAQALTYWRDRGRPRELVDRIVSPSGPFWLGLHTLPLAGEGFHVLVAVPEMDLVGEAMRERQRMAAVLAGAVAAAVLLALWLAGLYARPVGALVERSAAIQRLDLTPQEDIRSSLAEVRQLADAQSNMRAAIESFSRYVPREVIAELLRQGEAAKIGAHPAQLTVMFSDIRRFTALSENLPPDDIARYLSDYFQALHTLVARHQGTTDKFIGDALMAFWGAPRPDDQHALHAVEAALDCAAALDRLNQHWREAGRPEFHTTFGLATGSVVVGNVGASDRLNYTVLGSTVNLASRCVGLGRNLGCGVLAAESVMHATAGQMEWRRVGPVQVKGLIRPVLVCEPLGRVGEVAADVLKFRGVYESALDRYLERDFAAALPAAEALKEQRPRDLSVAFLERRCRELAAASGGEVHTTLLLFGRDTTAPDASGLV